MQNSRRLFIKNTGVALSGLSILPLIKPFQLIADPLFVPMAGSLPRALPASQGVSAKGLLDFITAANNSGLSWHSFILVRHGHVVAEGWWNPYAQEFVHSLFSLSKSFTSSAIGMLVDEGKLDISKPVLSFFPDKAPANPSANLQSMTVRHLLTMNTGHGLDTLPAMRKSNDSWIQTFLAQPVDHAPGSHFLYNSGATYMLGAIVHKITGKILQDFLAPRLFEPLNITGYDWETSPEGLNTAAYGLRVKTEDIAKFGQLYLQQGQWNGKTILSQDWVKAATSYQTSSQAGNGDWSQGYGYQFWQCRHNAYRGDGAFGQYCIVMPELDAVLAVTSQSSDMQQSMNIVWEHLLPAIQNGALQEQPEDTAALKHTLATLTLPIPKGNTSAALNATYHNKEWKLGANSFNAKTMRFAFDKQGCTWTTQTDKDTTVIRLGWEKWTLNKERQLYTFPELSMLPKPTRLAGTATWINDNTLQLNLRFVESLHGDRIQCIFDGNNLSVSFLHTMAEYAHNNASDTREVLKGTLS